MSAAGEATDARTSRAKPRPEGRACERGRHPMAHGFNRHDHSMRVPKAASPQESLEADAQDDAHHNGRDEAEAMSAAVTRRHP